MNRILSYVFALLTLALPSIPVAAGGSGDREKKAFTVHTVLEKGETAAGLGILSANLNEDNSGYLLLVKNLEGGGEVFYFRPSLAFAYKDNASIGFRIVFGSASLDLSNADVRLLSDDVSANLKDLDVNFRSFGGAVFHRNYFGLDSRGTAGLFCEYQLGYSGTSINYGTGGKNAVGQFKLLFSPGFILYILPMVSVEGSIGIADLTYIKSGSHDGSGNDGSFHRFGGGVKPNLLNSNFGISYHF